MSLYSAIKTIAKCVSRGYSPLAFIRLKRALSNPKNKSHDCIKIAIGAGINAHLRLGTSDVSVFQELFLLDEYRSGLQRLNLKPTRVLDLGANIGLSALLLHKNYPEAEIACIEPDEENFAVLQTNIAPYPNVRCIRCFVGPVDGEGYIQGTESWAMRFTRVPQSSQRPTLVSSVPSLLARLGWNSIDLLKCDIEGGERELFESCAPWIGKVRAILIETHGKYSKCDLQREVERGGAKLQLAHADETHAPSGIYAFTVTSDGRNNGSGNPKDTKSQ